MITGAGFPRLASVIADVVLPEAIKPQVQPVRLHRSAQSSLVVPTVNPSAYVIDSENQPELSPNQLETPRVTKDRQLNQHAWLNRQECLQFDRPRVTMHIALELKQHNPPRIPKPMNGMLSTPLVEESLESGTLHVEQDRRSQQAFINHQIRVLQPCLPLAQIGSRLGILKKMHNKHTHIMLSSDFTPIS